MLEIWIVKNEKIIYRFFNWLLFYGKYCRKSLKRIKLILLCHQTSKSHKEYLSYYLPFYKIIKKHRAICLPLIWLLSYEKYYRKSSRKIRVILLSRLTSKSHKEYLSYYFSPPLLFKIDIENKDIKVNNKIVGIIKYHFLKKSIRNVPTAISQNNIFAISSASSEAFLRC